jgi:hypothetical protein
MNNIDIATLQKHSQLETLPTWPARTIAILATVGNGPYAIPISAPLRTGDHRILLSLRHSRGSLARLWNRPRVALTILTEGNTAFTARGRAHIIQVPLAGSDDYAAVAIEVEHIDDHRQRQFVIQAGVDRRWIDENERRALGQRVATLTEIAVSGARPRG